MRSWIVSIIAAPLTLTALVAHAAPLPQAVSDMLRAAADEPDTLDAVVRAAKKANPDSVAEIDAEVKALKARAAADKAAEVANQGFFEGWSLKGELGGSISTGNTESEALAAALSAEKRTPIWVHDFDMSVDFKRENEETTKDRYFGAYSIQRNITPRFYGVGVLWGERDRFAGYNYRFSESLGVGYRLFDGPGLKLRVEGGPAARQSEYLVTGYDLTYATRLAEYLSWQITQRLEFSQSLVTYLETKNSTVIGDASVTTKLQKRLSARASYEVRHEASPPVGRKNTDTTTRLTLVFTY
ncbi:DUF481 domain-containing protein [Phenylobacterium sp.]|jgi:putative salt-induced outer membrane protein|uniref:DUF481 domain-containing protein n=1 Tax=Phenylobacterium sp. TaxID=1871053 RepID=UPI002F3EACAC